MRLSPDNCRCVQTACVQTAAFYGAERWWKEGEGPRATGRREELWGLANEQSRAATGRLRSTNQGTLLLEASGALTQQQSESLRPSAELFPGPHG